MKNFLAALLILISLSSHSWGDIVTLDFVSTQAITGEIDGNSFSSSDWSIRFDVDDTAADTELNPAQGYFENLIISGSLQIDSSTYLIDPSNFGTTELLLYDYSKSGGNLNVIAVYLDAGGIGFGGSNGTAFPNTFLDNNDISSATGSSSLGNSDANDPGYAGDFSFFNLLAMTGEMINIDYTVLGGGTTFVTSSQGSVAIPEPTISGLVTLSLLLLLSRRRRVAIA